MSDGANIHTIFLRSIKVEFKSLQFKSDSVSIKDRTFKGYASTWDKDQGNDIIQKGAFSKTLSERFSRVKVLWQHNQPLGMPSVMKEDDGGLYVEARVSKTVLGDEALELMSDGVVDQMSIGFSVPSGKSEYSKNDDARIIKEIKLFEFSPVTFPMNENAFITNVKSMRGLIDTETNLSDAELKQLALLVDELKALMTNGGAAHSTPSEPQPHDVDLFLKTINQLKLK